MAKPYILNISNATQQVAHHKSTGSTATLSKQASGAGQQEGSFVVSQQLVMPLEGFVRGFALQQQVMNKLLADGVLSPKAVSENH